MRAAWMAVSIGARYDLSRRHKANHQSRLEQAQPLTWTKASVGIVIAAARSLAMISPATSATAATVRAVLYCSILQLWIMTGLPHPKTR